MTTALFTITPVIYDSNLRNTLERNNIPVAQYAIENTTVDNVSSTINLLQDKHYQGFTDVDYELTQQQDRTLLTIGVDHFDFMHMYTIIMASTSYRTPYNVFDSTARYIHHLFFNHWNINLVILAFSRLLHKDKRKRRGILDSNSPYFGIYRKLETILGLVDISDDRSRNCLRDFIAMDDPHITRIGTKALIRSISDIRYKSFLNTIEDNQNLNNVMYPVVGIGMTPGHIIMYSIIADKRIPRSTRTHLLLSMNSNIDCIPPTPRFSRKIHKDTTYISNVERIYHQLERRDRMPKIWHHIIHKNSSVKTKIALQRKYITIQNIKHTTQHDSTTKCQDHQEKPKGVPTPR